MARLGRYFVEGQALHVVQRGNDRQAIFYAEGDYVLHWDWPAELAGRFDAQIHAWVLCKGSLPEGSNKRERR
jgi:putative transposase